MALPKGYRRLEYIECSGTQFIDTGVNGISSDALNIRLDIEWLSGTGYIYGADSPSGEVALKVSDDTVVWSYYLGESKKLTVESVLGRHTVIKSNYSVYFGTQHVAHSSQGNTLDQSLHIFSRSDGEVCASAARIYYGRIQNNSIGSSAYTVLREFVPCRNLSGEVGLWDDINSVFYGNAGSGHFVAGPEIASGGGGHHALINSTGVEIKSGRTLIGGTGYGIKKGRTLIDGTGYDIKLGVPIAQVPDGSIVKINEYGTPVDFYIATHFYEPALNPLGTTLLVRKDCWRNNIPFNTLASKTADFGDSNICSKLNTTYLEALDAEFANALQPTKFGVVNSKTGAITTLSKKYFYCPLMNYFKPVVLAAQRMRARAQF